MNIINIDINFKEGINKPIGIPVITGDYASTKLVFHFDREDGTKIFEMKNPSGEIRYNGEIINNEVVLTGINNGHNYSIFNQEGRYIYEVSLYKGDSKLTSVFGELPVAKEQVIINDEVVEPYLPIFDELMQDIENKIEEADSKIEIIDEKITDVNTAITQTNNLNIDLSDKVDKDVTITLTKKDNTTKSVVISDGLSLQFMWQGTSLGIKTDDMENYIFVDLQGIQGVPGPQGEPFRIKKTYPSVQAMNDDFNNMNYGDYVMIASSVEVQDNAKLYTRGESQWIFITDFSGATGIKGETGATPNIQIGNVTSGDTPSVTRTGTNENPVLNFVLKPGPQGIQGNPGPTGNGISNIEKTSETPTEKDYRINFTDGTHFDYSVENGEVTQEQLDETNAMNELLLDQIPKGTATGQDITITDSSNLPIKSIEISGNTSQDTTTGKNLLGLTNGTYSNNGITAVVDNGKITLSGTASAYSNISIPIVEKTFNNDTDLDLSISNITGTITDISISNTNYCILRASVGGTTSSIIETKPKYLTSKTYKTTDTTIIQALNITTSNGVSYNNYSYNIMLELGTTASSYEKYSGGIPAPNSSFPMDIHSVIGDNTLHENGKNFWNNNAVQTSGIVQKLDTGFKITKSGSSRFSDTYSMYIPAGNYKFYGLVNTNAQTNSSGFIFNYEDGTRATRNYSLITSHNETILLKNVVSVQLYIDINEGDGVYYEVNNLMIMLPNETDTSYLPYDGNTYQLNLPVENLFDGEIELGNISPDDGTLSTSTSRTRSVNYIKVKPNTTYSFTREITGSYRWIIGYTSSKNGITDGLVNHPASIYTSLFNETTFQITTTATTEYIKWYDTNSIDTNEKVMLEKGNVAHSYSPYGVEPIELNKIGDLEDIIIYNNINYNMITNIIHNSRAWTNGAIVNNDSYSRTDYIEVEPNAQYYIHHSVGSGVGFTCWCYDENKNPIQSVNLSTSSYDRSGTITTPNNTKYLIANFYNDTLISKIPSINIGSSPLPETTAWYKKSVITETELNLTSITTFSTATINGVPNTKYIAITLAPSMAQQGTSKTNNFYSTKNTFLGSRTTFEGYPAYTISRSIAIITTPDDTIENLKENLKNTKVYYQLETPTYTLLNDTLQEQLNAIWNMRTKKNVTNISITADDLKPYLDIVYRKDLETLLGG